MALTNQPYLPLYVNDWLSNNKLKSCSALSHGIMINIMLLMHKEDDYGTILLKQKFKQSSKQINNFALQLAKMLPFDFSEIETGLIELLDECTLFIDGDFLLCKRMIKDADISLKRSLSGSKGGKETMKKPAFAKAKSEANIKATSENESVNENEIIIENKSGKLFDDKETKKSKTFVPPTLDEVKLILDNVAAEKFINYYTSNGWKVGKNKMVNWQATANNWKIDNKKNNTKNFKNDSTTIIQSEGRKFGKF